MTPSLALPLRILGTGECLPQRTVDSTDFDRRWHQEPGWTERQCGVARRHVASGDETSSSLGAAAARQALAAAKVAAGDIDAIVSACSVMEQAIPCLASQIQARLGLGESGTPAFDVNATCLGFLAALDLVACAIAAGRFRRVLIVCSEIATVGLDPDDRTTAPLFGDGASAVVVAGGGDADGSALLGSALATFGVGAELCRVRAGGTRLRAAHDPAAWVAGARFEMDGRGLYRLAARHFPAFVAKLLQRASVRPDELACVVPHQASGQALDHMADSLGLPVERLVRTLGSRGNQVAASLPGALHHAITTGRLQRGDRFALLGTGAGLSLGGAVLRY